MKKICTLTIILLLLISPCLAFASGDSISADGLTSPIETLFDISLGMNLDEARQILNQEPYRSQWADRYKNATKMHKYNLFYDSKQDPASQAFRQFKRELSINADRTNTINQITYVLHFRSEAEYNKLVNSLVENANAEWGALQDEQITGSEKREALHRTWGKDNLHLSIATQYYPEYSPQFPYIVYIARTKS